MLLPGDRGGMRAGEGGERSVAVAGRRHESILGRRGAAQDSADPTRGKQGPRDRGSGRGSAKGARKPAPGTRRLLRIPTFPLETTVAPPPPQKKRGKAAQKAMLLLEGRAADLQSLLDDKQVRFDPLTVDLRP
eukprot:2788865-Rhodomonas_salina.2